MIVSSDKENTQLNMRIAYAYLEAEKHGISVMLTYPEYRIIIEVEDGYVKDVEVEW